MDVDPESSIAIQIVLIVVLTLINAYFAASEMAIVSVNKSKIHRLSEEGNKKAKFCLLYTSLSFKYSFKLISIYIPDHVLFQLH